MSQNLKGVAYDTECYTIVFIQVTSHNGEMFSFVNQLNNRMEFFWNRWSKWKNLLQPYSVHAFLVRSYNTRSDSGMGFVPDTHLCEFMNAKEARIFNAAYLTKYNKIYENSSIEEVNAFTCEFGNTLLDMQLEREEWEDVCERAANRAFSSAMSKEFLLSVPRKVPADFDWQRDIFNVDHIHGWCDEFVDDIDQPLNLKFLTSTE